MEAHRSYQLPPNVRFRDLTDAAVDDVLSLLRSKSERID